MAPTNLTLEIVMLEMEEKPTLFFKQANYINALAVTILRFFEPAGHYIG
jgi:hypothetical protein